MLLLVDAAAEKRSEPPTFWIRPSTAATENESARPQKHAALAKRDDTNRAKLAAQRQMTVHVTELKLECEPSSEAWHIEMGDLAGARLVEPKRESRVHLCKPSRTHFPFRLGMFVTKS